MAKSLKASAVAGLLDEYGQRLALRGESRFKTKAYHRAAESLRALTRPLADVIATGQLQEIPGVGAAIAGKIRAFHESGTDPRLEAMRREVPASVVDMVRIPGLASEKVLQLYRQLGIASLDELETACREDRLKEVKGLGPALQDRILQGIGMLRQSYGARLIHHAAELLAAAEANLRRSHPELTRITAAGSFRRGCELVPDLRLVAEIPGENGGDRTVRLGGDVTLHLATRRDYGAALLFATGSPAHVAALQAIAASRDILLDETGLRRAGRPISCADEKQVYKLLGLPCIEPELREGRGEIELALAGRLPKLVCDADIRGVLHSHTDSSDGANTLAEMAEAARARGHAYYGVTDHSQAAAYARGLALDQIEAQHALADEMNAGYRGRFRIFKGIEADILQDGTLDYGGNILDRFDFVVASVHSRFGLDEAAQTSRIVRAVSDPHATILGHMTGRLLLRRDGYRLDVDRVLEACAEHGVAVEVNANPHRLDLDWRWHQRALELGCMLSINADAHSTAELDLTHWGVTMARKGRVPKQRVLNCLDSDGLAAHLDNRRRGRPRRRASALRRHRRAAG